MSQYKRLFSVAIIFACVLLAINFGLRSSMGFFMKPISEAFNQGREVFAFSLALQNLLWGLAQPFAGIIADRYGSAKAIIGGAVLYALGLYITANADSVWELHTGAGILLGMGIAGTGFGVVLPAMARMVAPEKRGFALGPGTPAGSAGPARTTSVDSADPQHTARRRITAAPRSWRISLAPRPAVRVAA